MPKYLVSVKAYDSADSLVFEKSMTLTSWYEGIHPIVDSNGFRQTLGVVRLDGTQYDANGNFTNWVSTYRQDGTTIESRDFRADGSLIRSSDFREDGSIRSATTYGNDGEIKGVQHYGFVQRKAAEVSDDVDNSHLNLFSEFT